MTVRTALVIGGGIAGPVAAMALQKAGISATVYEAYATTSDGIGVTITVAPNGVAALSIIDCEEAVRGIGLPMWGQHVTDGYGGKIGNFPLVVSTDNHPALGLWRDELARVLHEQAKSRGIEIHYGKRLVDATETADGVTATFEDGSTATADILVGADGINSRVRKIIDPDAPAPTVTPMLNFGSAVEWLVPNSDAETMYFSFGTKDFFGYWVQPDGRTAWFANAPEEKLYTFREANQIPKEQWLQRLKDDFADDVPAREVLKHQKADELVVIGSIESITKVPHWYSKRMVCLGDAVHGPSPSSGQGASMACESGIQLARCLRDIDDPEKAFAAFEKLRRERVEKIIKRGAQTTQAKAVPSFVKSIMKLAFPLLLKTVLNPEKTLGPEQRYRIDWDAPVTSEVTV